VLKLEKCREERGGRPSKVSAPTRESPLRAASGQKKEISSSPFGGKHRGLGTRRSEEKKKVLLMKDTGGEVLKPKKEKKYVAEKKGTRAKGGLREPLKLN